MINIRDDSIVNSIEEVLNDKISNWKRGISGRNDKICPFLTFYFSFIFFVKSNCYYLWFSIYLFFASYCIFQCKLIYDIVWNEHRYQIYYIPYGPGLLFEVATIGFVDIVRHSLFWNLWEVLRDLYEHLFIHLYMPKHHCILIGTQLVTALFKQWIVEGMYSLYLIVSCNWQTRVNIH